MNKELVVNIDILIQNYIDNEKSVLFGVKSKSKIIKLIQLNNNKRKNAVDKNLWIELENFKKNYTYPSVILMLKDWQNQNENFTQSTNPAEKKQAPRAPYSYDTHKLRYNEPNIYFQSDVADLKAFNKDQHQWRPKYCLVTVDGVSGKLYLHAMKNKNEDSTLEAFQKLFEFIPREKDHSIYLQTDGGGEFFNKKFQKWCYESNIDHFKSKNYGKAYLAENAIGKLKMYLRKWTQSKKNKLTEKNWDFYLPEIESYFNDKIKPNGLTANDLNNDTIDGKVLRMIDRHYSSRRRKYHFMSNNINRVKKEKENKKLNPLKVLKVGMNCYLRRFKKEASETFYKSSTRKLDYWDTSKKVGILKIKKRKNVVSTDYSPIFKYLIKDGNEKKWVRREDLLPVNEKDTDIYYKSVSDYNEHFLSNIEL